MKRCLFLVMIAFGSSLSAGEWMFRLRDAHVQLRKAMFDRDPIAAWEHVDRETRQQAGWLAGEIRRRYEDLPAESRRQLCELLDLNEDEVRSVSGGDLLVSPAFLSAHPELLVGDRDDLKLKDHGTRMALPTGIRVAKGTPAEVFVEYTFSVQDHFGGQAMDYRARFAMPPFDVLKPVREPVIPSADEQSQQTLAVFERARKAVAKGDVDALWPLLDCDSQSQASHFADQVQSRSSTPDRAAEVAARLGVEVSDLDEVTGPGVWALPWSTEELRYFIEAENPRFVPASGYQPGLVAKPKGNEKSRGRKGQTESTVEFESLGRTWQLPVRVNHRDGEPRMTLYLRPPFYKRIRG